MQCNSQISDISTPSVMMETQYCIFTLRHWVKQADTNATFHPL